MVRFFWRIAFFALATSVFAGERLNALVTAAQDFSVAIQEQLAAVQSDISATQLVERTVSYAKAKRMQKRLLPTLFRLCGKRLWSHGSGIRRSGRLSRFEIAVRLGSLGQRQAGAGVTLHEIS